MMKIKLRKNLIYLLIYFICTFVLYNVIGFFIDKIFEFDSVYICIFLSPIGNIIGGLIVFLYQKYSLRKREKIKYFGIKLIHNKKNIAQDRKLKIILLIFFAAFFNYYNFILNSIFSIVWEPGLTPWSMALRLSGIQIIISTLIYIYAFGFIIKKHHKISLIIIGIFMFLSISTDMIFMVLYTYHNNLYKYLGVVISKYFLTLYYYIGFSFGDCIEKYLVDYNYMNPFIILMLEGVFQLIMASLSIIKVDPFKPFENIKKLNNKALFIFLFILYTLLQVLVNIYRIYCNVIYSPMARSLIDYLLNPLIIIYSFCILNDFYHITAYFIIAEIICIVMSFFGCVFNEYIIIYCGGLELETKDEIADRADSQLENELDIIDDISIYSENDENDVKMNGSNINKSFDNNGLGI